MNAYVIMGLVIVLLFVCLMLKEGYDYKKRKAKLYNEARKSFGTFNTKKLSPDEMLTVKKLFYRYQNENSIDDITASDLSIDDIFEKYNNCLSAPGRDYFYYLLRNPEFDEQALNSLEEKISFMYENDTERDSFRAFFLSIGNMRKTSFLDCIDLIDSIKSRKYTKEMLATLILLAGIGFLFVEPTVGIMAIIFSACFNIVTYYKDRGDIEHYIILFSFITRLIDAASEITKKKCDVLSFELEKIEELCNSLKKISRYSFGVSRGAGGAIGAGNPLDIFVDYIKMLFHIDIFMFYKMLSDTKEHLQDIEELYILLGKIEAYINIASIRKSVECFCVPTYSEGISAVNIYHPLLDNPVKNSITASNGILITGSNASGKSTFLKAVAINAVFAGTIHTCLADSFSIDKFNVFSSMSLRDDINNHDSYFMVEIKALKRIFDYVSKYPEKKVLCFVDELLRGTNTVERIAACTQILLNLSASKVLCFAATHDIELTRLLDKEYTNYHFDEDVVCDDVLFNYKLKDGKATSKNAIKLLSIMGFSEEVVSKAKVMADDFSDNGIWRC